jgi:SAM-dependent methyltransferase
VESARDANDRFAPIYDAWNAQNDYELWLGDVLLPVLEDHGLRKGWALDLGCGTGRAFEPLLARGWQVVGCDVSLRMLAEAGRKFGSRVQLLNVDARHLPAICRRPGLPGIEGFQLILMLNDVVNYLTADGDLEQVFLAVKRNLNCDHGLMVFDANTLALFRADYASGTTAETHGWRWRGLTDEVKSGAIFEGQFVGPGVEAHVHRQRHWTTAQVTNVLAAAGLRCLAVFGQREEGHRILLSEPPNEERDAKVVYVTAHH